ncbi:aspartic peptidase domain-containing protein [Hysterangium stoloniferum]|nr:aspartic peptidase domain-containing protein [Hysterangium stoloniferum]
MMLPRSLLLLILPSILNGHQIPEIVTHPKRTEGGIHLPIYRHETPASSLERRAGTATSSIGLGDFNDITYNIMVSMGGTLVPLVLDTGSSDLWTVTDACRSAACRNADVPIYPQATFQSANLDVKLFYGDSTSGTHAFGEVGKDTVGVAGLSLTNQFFGAINDTDSSALNTSAAGIAGFGFPVNSAIWVELFKAQFPHDFQPAVKRSTAKFPDIKALMGGARAKMQREISRGTRYLPDFRRKPFPDLAGLLPKKHKSSSKRRSASSASLPDLVNSFITNGPIISRLAQTALAAPQFTVSLQRDSFDIGSGNQGMLSLGEFPAGLTNDSFTWVPLRAYTAQQGGIDSPTDTYPIAWEVPIDNVSIDGQLLPTSMLSPNVSVTALIDTGNSIIRGPKDVVDALMTSLSASRGGNVNCATPHVMSFQIGGKMFPVDPRDFVSGTGRNTKNCAVNVVSTDPPSTGFLYSWSLGDTFLKSNIVTFYFGNLTHPSQDPPRMGFMSTVPADAVTQYANAVSAAGSIGGFPSRVESAPTNNSTVPATTFNVPVPTLGIDRNSDGHSTGGQSSDAMRLGLPGLGLCIVGLMGAIFGSI